MLLSEDLQRRVGMAIDSRLGLHYTESRRGELGQGLERAIRECGVASLEDFVAKLESQDCPPLFLDSLTRHLAIGETYFFRHHEQFRFLETVILPTLIHDRKARAAALGIRPRLGIWSAACSTGEEAWSVAISLRRVMHTLSDWDITILGTDVNKGALHTARRGEYGEWSFRSVPAQVREAYFERLDAERERIKRELLPHVIFHPLNFFDPHARFPEGQAWKPDIVFCRNVLYYFSPERIASVLAMIAERMAEDGWLLVGPSESFAVREAGFVFAGGDATSIFRPPKYQAAARYWGQEGSIPSAKTPLPDALVTPRGHSPGGGKLPAMASSSATNPPQPGMAAPDSPGRSGSILRGGSPGLWWNPASNLWVAPAVSADSDANQKVFPPIAAVPDGGGGGSFAEAVRLANLGLYREARVHCEAAIAEDRLDPDRRYISGVVHLEAGERNEAAEAFRRTLALDPGHIMARYLLASVATAEGNHAEAARIFGDCLDYLSRMDPGTPVPWSEGLDAGSLASGIRAMLSGEAGDGR